MNRHNGTKESKEGINQGNQGGEKEATTGHWTFEEPQGNQADIGELSVNDEIVYGVALW